MTVTQIDPRPHSTAILAALNATLAPQKAYPIDGIPGTTQNALEAERKKALPGMYVELGIEPRYVPPVGMVPRSTRGGWRATTVCVGRTVNETYWVMNRAEEALRNQSLVIDGERVGPVFLESARKPEWDNVRWSALLVFTYST